MWNSEELIVEQVKSYLTQNLNSVSNKKEIYNNFSLKFSKLASLGIAAKLW